MELVVSLFAAGSIGGADLILFLTSGIIGGFTTWSTFSLDAVTLWERGEPYAAAGYVLASLILSFLAIAGVLVAARPWT